MFVDGSFFLQTKAYHSLIHKTTWALDMAMTDDTIAAQNLVKK